MNSKVSNLDLDSLESLLRQANVKAVTKILRSINTSRIPRDQILKVANLCRRVGLLSLGLRLLNPFIRPDKPLKLKATPEELTEYAVLLARSGVTAEARQILDEIDSEKYPEVILFKTFTLTPEWRYQETIPLLKNYLKKGSASSYMQLVAEVNLIAALIYEARYVEANKYLINALASAKENNHKLLYGSLLELAAQSAIQQNNLSEASHYLKKARAMIGSMQTKESLYVEKWQAILEIYRHNGHIQLQKVLSIKSKAINEGAWEVARDCDFHLAFRYMDKELWKHLYFGTPFESFRQKIVRVCGDWVEKEKSYMWQLNSSAGKDQCFDISLGKDSSGKIILSPGQMPHRLMACLTQDFYRPQKLPALGAQLFPKEFYDPVYTPLRIHKNCDRLRQTFKLNNMPFAVEAKNGSLRLVGTGNIIVHDKYFGPLNNKSAVENIETMMKILSQKFKANRFSTQEASKMWNCSVSTATRRLTEAEERGICTRVGRGRGTAFKISKL